MTEFARLDDWLGDVASQRRMRVVTSNASPRVVQSKLCTRYSNDIEKLIEFEPRTPHLKVESAGIDAPGKG